MVFVFRKKYSEVKNQQLQSIPYDSLIGSDQPQDLWDRAHKLLREDKSKKQLLIAYEKILLSELDKDVSPITSVDWGSRDRTTQVSCLIEEKLKALRESSWKLQLGKQTVEVKRQIEKIIKTVLWAQSFVSSAISADPHAALAWAGVSLLLPLLLSPTSQTNALVDGLAYISTLIARFTIIEGHFRHYTSALSTSCDSSGTADLALSYEIQVTKLYSQILIYQARVVCQLPRNALVRYGRDVLKADDWSTMLAEIKATELDCGAISDVINAEKVNAVWHEQESQMDKLLHSEEGHYQSLQQTTDQIGADLRQGLETQKNWYRTAGEAQCLQALCTSTYADHKDINPDRVPGTCQWFLNNEKFHEWAESDSSDLLWVTADPGCGKSVLSKSLVDGELQSTLSLTTAYYFFKDDSPEQRSATHAVCALIHQICSQNSALLEKVLSAYQTNGNKLSLSFSWLWDLLLEIAQSPEAGEIVCVMDALDECAEGGKNLLIDSFNKLYSPKRVCKGRLKFLVTSRPYLDIEERFDRLVVRLSGEDESQIIKQEIDLVIVDRVSKLASMKRLDPETKSALQNRLLQTENRTYLWLYLTLDGVEKEFGLATPKRMRGFIDALPRTVNQAYGKLLDRSPRPEQARKLLHIVLAAIRPLTLREMNMAFNIEDGQKSREEVDLDPEDSFGAYVKNLCGLLVSIFDAKIFLLHQTVKEFLLPSVMTTAVARDMWRDSMKPSESHLILAKKCLYYLSFTVFDEDMSHDHERPNASCCGEDPHYIWCKALYPDKGKLDPRKFDPICRHHMDNNYDFLNYAAMYWTDHYKFARDDMALTRMWYYVCDVETRRFAVWYQAWMEHQDRVPITKSVVKNTSPLILASVFGHDGMVLELLEANAQKESRDQWGRTALANAAMGGHERVVRSLVQAGALTHGIFRPKTIGSTLFSAKDLDKPVFEILIEDLMLRGSYEVQNERRNKALALI